MNSTGNSEVKRDIEGVCVCVCVCVCVWRGRGRGANYTLFIMQERRPHRERGGLFKRLAMACLLALALIPSHLPFSSGLAWHPQRSSQIIDEIHFD